MIRTNTVKEVREIAQNMSIEGKTISIEFYRDGTGWDTDTIGEYVDIVPDNAVCDYNIVDKEGYSNTVLSSTRVNTDDVWDPSLDYVILVNLATDITCNYITK